MTTPVEQDDLGLDASVSARLSIAIGDAVSARVRQALDARDEAARRDVPIRAPIYGSGNSSAGNLISVGGPSAGRIWIVRRLAVLDGTSVFNTVAGSAAWFTGSFTQGPITASTSPLRCVELMAALPVVKHYTSDVITIGQGERLMATINGGDGGLITLTGQVLDMPAIQPGGNP